MISHELVLEFQQIVKEECGKELNYDEAEEISNGIVNYFKHLKEAYIEIHKNDPE